MSRIAVSCAALAAALVALPAFAQEPPSGIGVQVQAGLGTGNFIEDVPNQATGNGPSWDVRALVGSQTLLGLEAGYVGSAQSIQGFGLEDSTVLLSNGLETALRVAPKFDVAAVSLTPFAFGGVGWQHHNVLAEEGATGSLADADNVLTLPAGAGLELGLGQVSLEGRFTYRHALGSELFGASESSFDDRALRSWDVGAGLGFEF